MRAFLVVASLTLPAWALLAVPHQEPATPALQDSDFDGLPDPGDSCPELPYEAGFRWRQCAPMDLNPANDADPECQARERVAALLLQGGVFTTRIAFAVIEDGQVHFADAFRYLGGGAFARDPRGIRRLYRIGSTSKPIVAVAAQRLEAQGVLTLDDFVDDEDGRLVSGVGERTLRQLLRHDGAFRLDSGALHLWAYPGDLPAFWAEPNELVSPRYDSAVYGNLGGGYQYSAFNYSLAGAHLAIRTGSPFRDLIQDLVFDATGMCTASFDGARAVTTSIAGTPGVAQAASMHVGPTINLRAPTDPLLIDNYYSSDALPGDPYTWLYYRLDEADAEARDPAGGVIASALDLAEFCRALLASYHGSPGAILSPTGIRALWAGHSDLGCGTGCAYQPYYGTGFFTSSPPGNSGPIHEVEHGGSRPGYASAMVLRPEENRAVVILANSDLSTVLLSDTAKAILDDFR